MAARRLLIIMLILLGLSTLAAALVPQRTLNDGSTSNSTTRSTPATTAPGPPSPLPPVAEITVGVKKFPVVPVRVGDQFTLLVLSRRPREISIPEFGLVGFATPDTPARFELLPEVPGTFGIVFAASGKAAGQIRVVEGSAKKKKKKGGEKRKPRSPAPSGSNPA
jgi:hypothetical protein